MSILFTPGPSRTIPEWFSATSDMTSMNIYLLTKRQRIASQFRGVTRT